MNKDVRPDSELSDEQERLVSGISVEEMVNIDQALKSQCTDYWQKMSKVIGSYMLFEESVRTKLPDIFYAQRIRKLISDGQIESRGYIESMRYCEVKLSSAPET